MERVKTRTNKQQPQTHGVGSDGPGSEFWLWLLSKVQGSAWFPHLWETGAGAFYHKVVGSTCISVRSVPGRGGRSSLAAVWKSWGLESDRVGFETHVPGLLSIELRTNKCENQMRQCSQKSCYIWRTQRDVVMRCSCFLSSTSSL